MNRKLTLLPIAAVFLIGGVAAASAQYSPPPQFPPVSPTPPIDPAFQGNIPPPMDMTWAIDSQIELYNRGQLDARAAFDLCMRLSAEVRRRGGDPGNCGADAASLRASIGALSEQFHRNNQAAQRNSVRTHDAIEQTCSWIMKPEVGVPEYHCP